ncbi:MAG: cation:proton antiporter [Lentisphaerales bacterium]|nr:cation:proton antiporter [Lentisphaerales bacterium]
MADFGVLLILGIGVFGGILGAAFFQRFRFPPVVGYITIGLIIGQSGLKLISKTNINEFSPLNDFALGVIGFLVGTELKIPTFKKYGRQLSALLFGEVICSFILVSVGMTFILKCAYFDWNQSLAMGLIFGAISSATDPASTSGFIWENRARGILSSTVMSLIALDDAVAMALFGISLAVCRLLLTEDSGTLTIAFKIILSIAGALLTGLLLAWILNMLFQKMSRDKRIVLTMGTLLLAIGITRKFNLDVILGTMLIGFLLANRSPRRSEEVFKIFKIFASPIYVIFGILIGARMNLFDTPGWLWFGVIIYVATRCIGKIYGSRIAAKYTECDEVIQKYSGYCLLSQGGIAAGLAIIASQQISTFTDDSLHLGDTLVYGITSSTLIMQFLAQPFLRKALNDSGEKDKNVTKEDVINQWHVQDVLHDTDAVNEAAPLMSVMNRFSNEDFLSLPVVNKENAIVGTISLDNMKELLTDQNSWMWMLTADVMEPVKDTFYLNTPLDEALNIMQTVNIDEAPVLKSISDPTLVGVITLPYTRICLSREILKRQGEVDQS